MFYSLKIGAIGDESIGDESIRADSWDICKDTESNLGPFAGF